MLFKVFQSRASAKNVTWRLELPERLPIINADPVRLRQILLNLLSNAMPLYASREPLPSAPKSRCPTFTCGLRIPALEYRPQDQDRIFEPFVTAEHDGEIKGGIGLGLSITRWLVTLHGGKMALESQPGKGSLFHVYLPLPNLKEGRAGMEKPGQPALLYISGD